jgi:alpha-mannosidase
MTYSNPLSQRLALGLDDLREEGKIERLLADLRAKILVAVPGEIAWRICRDEIDTATALAADISAWPILGPRAVWSKPQGHSWFAARVTVPAAAAGKTFVLRFASQWQDRPGTTDPQCLAYLDGRPAQALDGNHTELVVMRDAVPGTVRDLRIDAFTFFDRPLVGLGVEFLVRHERIEALWHDLDTPFEVARRLHQTDARRHAILGRVDRALRALDRRGAGVTPGLEASLPAAEAIAAEIYALADTEAQPVISAFGHTHLDVAWLWRVLHTRDKTGRSFATVLALMAEYPGFVFMYNQAVLFDFLKHDYPEIWAGVVAAVRRGQFDIDGAMWVEPDANLVSGESMVRQILWGRRFHLTEFGIAPTCVWLPDTFGYSANMPQIIRKSGLGFFLTSKLSWNDTDRHPYDTFFWRGIDGTEVKAHLITAQKFESEAIFTTYNSDLSVSEVMGAWKRYEPKAVHAELALCYGYGDGGGGPTRAMIERGQRLARGIPGAPRLRLEGLRAFLARLGPKMEAEAQRFPRWNGELYLQYHRGTLTSVARTKLYNRLAERLLREAEFLGALAHALAGHPWPAEALERGWRTVLINQFHDILPGTSIPEVYADSDAGYEALMAEFASANGPLLAAARALPGAGDGARLINVAGRARDGALAELPADLAGQGLVTGGTAETAQAITRADGSAAALVPVHGVPPLGWAALALALAAEPGPGPGPDPGPGGLIAAPDRLENGLLALRLDGRGEIVSLIDKTTGREAIAPGQLANRLVAYEDKPMDWDAWDIDWYFEQQSWPLGPAVVAVQETGPHRAALRLERRYGASRIVQVLSLAAGARMVEFDTYIDWQERQTLLKAVFPFDMNVSELRSEIQFGHVRRPTHRNTSWDRARFEASMHRWVDLSEPDFGAALINDCKYAYDAHEQVIRLTLLRGPTHPHPGADLGEHRLRYALLLHGGTADLERVHHAAEAFNTPLRLVGTPRPGDGRGAFCFASVDAPNVALETLKKAEASEALVLRLYEHANRRAFATVTFGLPVRSVRLVNLMEEEPSAPLALTGNAVSLPLRPFEIATLLIET